MAMPGKAGLGIDLQISLQATNVSFGVMLAWWGSTGFRIWLALALMELNFNVVFVRWH
jgi:hypothetical protein